jgi:tetratricopeptide (TPR) repeat protein
LILVAAIIGIGASARKSQAQPAQADVPNATGISVESSPQIFATMCALDAAGFDADESTISEMPARLALREELLKLHGPATVAMRQFYRDHALANPTETLSPFITFAMVADAPPGFQLPGNTDLLPPSVLTIDGFQPLLISFYQEANLSARWDKVEPESEPLINQFRSVVRHVVMVSDAYLRELEKPANGRAFTVYVEPLVGARTNFRNSGDHYSIVVGSLNNASVDTIQHAYLHFMLDRFVLRYRPVVDNKRALLNVAARAPQLPIDYRDDFISLFDECLIKAVELRLRHLPADQQEAELKNNDAAGFILVRPFVTQLQKFEKDAPAMSYYFPTLLLGIDVDAEQKRLQGFTYAAATAEPVLGHGAHGQSDAAQPSELERWVAAGNRQIASKDIAGASETFEAAIAKYPGDSRVVYGMAIASVLSGKANRARDLFEQLVAARDAGTSGSAASDQENPSIMAWSHVYLGRIHDLEDERELAVNEYQAALAVPGAPEAARLAAQNGVDSPYAPPGHPEDNQQRQ